MKFLKRLISDVTCKGFRQGSLRPGAGATLELMLRFAPAWARYVLCAGSLFGPWHARSVQAQSAENVAVVINDNSPDSQRIGEHYARTRALPATNVIRIRVSPDDTIDRGVYAASIEAPILAAIRSAGLQDRLLYLVLTKGVPLRIAGTTGLSGTLGSVDSELRSEERRMTGQPVPP